jgi:hypothetical protein
MGHLWLGEFVNRVLSNAPNAWVHPNASKNIRSAGA